MKRVLPVLILLVALSLAAQAQTITFSGQIRERSELDTKSLTIRANTDAFHLLRTRLRADASINEKVSAVVEVQDARTYGGKQTTLNTGASAFDLRQGFVEVRDVLTPNISVRLGRQVLSYGNERVLGAIEWNNFGQSFDAVLLRYKGYDFTWDVFGAAVARNPYTNNGLGYARDVYLTGLWGTWKPEDTKATLNFFALYDNPSITLLPSVSSRMYRFTSGLQFNNTFGDLDLDVDGAVQSGSIANTDISIGAFMVGGRLGYSFPDLANLRIGVGADILSGQDPKSTDTYESFNTMYGTNYKFYGYMDYFTSFPAHVEGLGLKDFFVQLSCTPAKDWKLAVDGHLFSTFIDPNEVASGTSTTDYSSTIGMEVDLTVSARIHNAVNLMGGFSIFDWEKDRAIDNGRKTTNWAYLMTTVNF